MNLYHLQCFQVVAQENHITRASKVLNIAQPALSANIAKLENELGVSLFDRVGRQIVLNSNGQILLEHVNKILYNWDTARARLDQNKQENLQQVRIASTGLVFSQSLIRDFKMARPEYIIKQSNILVNEIESALMHQTSDYVLSSVVVDNAEIEACTLTEEPLYLLMNVEHRLAGRDSVSIEDIKDEGFIALPKGYAYRLIIDDWFEESGYRHNVVFECFPYELETLVEQGIGLTFISDRSVKSGVHPPGVVWVPIEPTLIRYIYILRKKTRAFSRACNDFYQYAVDYSL